MLDKIIRERRTIREYTQEIPPLELRKKVAEAGLYAPTATNSQPFLIRELSKDEVASIQNLMEKRYEELLAAAESCEDKKVAKVINFYWRFSKPVLAAPIVWLFLGEKTPSFTQRLQDAGLISYTEAKASSAMRISLGCVIQNMLLKAKELGLGSGVYSAPFIFLEKDESALLEDLGIDSQKYFPAEFLTIGYPAENPDRPHSKTLDEVFKYNE
ncbi:MAG: nitroreductase family protein [Spirochaetales bacterium]|nr:nitroreductase family protein [Spirochaetales bacterium]